MTGHLHHPLADGVALGVVASLLAAFGVGWGVARHYLGPTRSHSKRLPVPRRPRAA